MKRIVPFSIPLSIYLALTPSALAEPLNVCPQGSSQFDALCALRTTEFGKIIGTVITFIFIIAIIIAVAFLIYGGIKWILSGGDKTAVEGARNHIVAALVGLIIVFLAYFIINIVVQFFIPGFSLTNIQLPHL